MSFKVIGMSGVWDLAPAESHLPILGADADMFSTLIQADLVDLHWTLWVEKSSSLKLWPARCKYSLKSKAKHLTGSLDDITWWHFLLKVTFAQRNPFTDFFSRQIYVTEVCQHELSGLSYSMKTCLISFKQWLITACRFMWVERESMRPAGKRKHRYILYKSAHLCGPNQRWQAH